MDGSEVELVYRDLMDALRELDAGRPSTVKVRRTFARFISLTQQLTATMRVDFKARTGSNWEARQFPGWNPVTDFFKQIRNVGEHQSPILVLVRERQYVRPFPDSATELVFEGTWELHDQLEEVPPEGIAAVRADPESGRPSEEVIPPARREFDFLIHGRTEEIKTLLSRAGTDDLHELAHRCFDTLSEYVEFYRCKLKLDQGNGARGLSP